MTDHQTTVSTATWPDRLLGRLTDHSRGLSLDRAAFAVIAAIAAFHILKVFLTPFDLHGDEAQYWTWSLDPAAGYYSKPPLIAWVLGLTTSLCGHGEVCIRLASPLLHGSTACALFILARMLYGTRTAFWAGVSYITLGGIWYSATLITTDVPLLFVWSLALVAAWKVLQTRSWDWAIATGLLIGTGFLAKYAMMYFVFGFAIAALLLPEGRRLIRSPQILLMGLLALAVFSPNIIWNWQNDFPTVAHTVDNAELTAEKYNLDSLAKFLGGQLGVMGPILFPALIWGLITLRRRLRTAEALEPGMARKDLFLLAFALPPLAVMCFQAFLTKANANWAVTAYPAATVLVTAWLLRSSAAWLVPATVFLRTGLGVIVGIGLLSPALIDAVGLSNATKRLHGWEELGALTRIQLARTDDGVPYTAILTRDRMLHAELVYYARPHTVPILAFPADHPEDHYQFAFPFTGQVDGPLLFVTRSSSLKGLDARFDRFEQIGEEIVRTGKGKNRTYRFFAVDGYRGRSEGAGTDAAQPAGSASG